MKARTWTDVKSDLHRRFPNMADPDKQAKADAAVDSYIVGYELKELRKSMGMTQQEVADVLGTTQPRVSQIENGDVDTLELNTLRAYVSALGGHIDVMAHVGPRSVRVA